MISSGSSLVGAMALLVTLCLSGCGNSVARYLEQESKRAKADALVDEAQKKIATDDVKGEISLLKEATDVDPTYAKAWMRLCDAYQETGELDLALAACQREVDLDRSALSHNSVGLVYLAKKDYARAAPEFEKAAKDSNASIIHYNLVWSLLGSGQYQKAIPAAQRMINVSESDPSNRAAGYQMLAAAHRKLGQKDEEQAALQKLRQMDVPSKNVKSCEFKPDGKGAFTLDCIG